jgi:hypothetical protein
MHLHDLISSREKIYFSPWFQQSRLTYVNRISVQHSRPVTYSFYYQNMKLQSSARFTISTLILSWWKIIWINCDKTRAKQSWVHYTETTTQMMYVLKRQMQTYCAIDDIMLALEVLLSIKMEYKDSSFVRCYTVQCVILLGPTNNWRWRCYIPLKCQDMLHYPLHSVTSQKTRKLNIWNLTWWKISLRNYK